MTCSAGEVRFRLLDALVGWDADVVEGLTGLDAPSGITLAPTAAPHDRAALARALPPARLARGCGPCEWFLVTRCPPRSRLLRLDACADGWRPVWRDRCDPDVLRSGVAVAVHGDRIAVADPGAGRVWIWRGLGRELLAAVPLADPGPLVWAPWGEWLVADRRALRLRRLDPAGLERPGAVPTPGTAERIGVDRDCRVWLVTRDRHVHRVWRWARGEPRFTAQSVQALLAAFPDTGLRGGDDESFCITRPGRSGPACFDAHGRAVAAAAERPAQPLFERQGQLLTLAVDSGIPRTRWHRVRVDVDVPPGTDVAIAVATQEEPTPAAQGVNDDPLWQAFAPGVPHPADWDSAPHGKLDYVLSQPPGRYAFVRLRLRGDGLHTPVVRRVRLDFPRRTSLENLPAVYRENPQAESFTERFLAIFDAAVEDIDRAIERHPALLDVEAVPGEVLPWLGSFLDVAMDPAWPPEQRRAVLKAIPDLYRLRGTPAGLRRTLQLLFGMEPAIREIALERPWGAVGDARLRAVRLFGRSEARLRVGSSALSRAPLWSVGDPNRDAVGTGAFTFQLLVPQLGDGELRERIVRVVESQKPAHTVATVHGGGGGLIVGMGTHVGIDTALVALPPPVLRAPTRGVRLGRDAVLWSGRPRADLALRTGRGAAVGVNTVME